MSAVGQIEEFDITQPLTWDSYAERVNFYLEANGITDEGRKRAVLLSVCGPKTYSVVRSLVSPAAPSTKSYVDLIALLKGHFSPNPSEIFQRFQFHRRNQQVDEGISAYVAELRHLAEHCNFGATLELTLRDRLVCGMRDENLQRRLLAETTLSFSQALDRALAAEAASKNTKEIRCASTSEIHQVQGERKRKNQRHRLLTTLKKRHPKVAKLVRVVVVLTREARVVSERRNVEDVTRLDTSSVYVSSKGTILL